MRLTAAIADWRTASKAIPNAESRGNIAVQKPYCTRGKPVTGCAAFKGRTGPFQQGMDNHRMFEPADFVRGRNTDATNTT